MEVEVPTGEVDGGGDPVTETYNPHTYSTYTNMDGYWNLRTHLSYGLPVSFLKSNLNVMAGVNYTLTPTLVARKATDGSVYLNNGEIVGGERNDASRLSYDFRAVLGSNISENVDFTLSWHGAYNIAKMFPTSRISASRTITTTPTCCATSIWARRSSATVGAR